MKHKINITKILCTTVVAGTLLFGASNLHAEGLFSKKTGAAGDFSRGAKAWSENCTRCHNLRDPKEFNDELWAPTMLHMRLRAGLTGQETRDILKFLRQSNTPSAKVSVAPVNKKAKSSKTQVSMKDVLKGANVANGKAIFEETCFACHGDDGKGSLPGAPNFTKKGGVLSQSSNVLVDHVTNGFQTPGSPMAMPAKGGNEDMTSSDVRDVVKYIKQTFYK